MLIREYLTRLGDSHQYVCICDSLACWVHRSRIASILMSIVVEVAVPAEEFALGQTFELAPDVAIEIECHATHSRKWVMPFLWATEVTFDAFDAAMTDDPSVDSFEVVDQTDEVGLYVVYWSETVAKCVDELIDKRATVLEATASDGVWFFKFRFLDQDQLDVARDYFDELGKSFEVLRLYTMEARKHRAYDLTPAQYEILIAALEAGYFEVPRETKLPELADSLGISSNAASGRLRRAYANLVRNTLTVSPPRTSPTGDGKTGDAT